MTHAPGNNKFITSNQPLEAAAMNAQQEPPSSGCSIVLGFCGRCSIRSTSARRLVEHARMKSESALLRVASYAQHQ